MAVTNIDLHVTVYSKWADEPGFRAATGIEFPFWSGPIEVAISSVPDPVRVINGRQVLVPMEILDQIFETFNINHPPGYQLPSLSTGDIVTFQYDEHGAKYSYRCDPVGWAPVGPDEAEKAVRPEAA